MSRILQSSDFLSGKWDFPAIKSPRIRRTRRRARLKFERASVLSSSPWVFDSLGAARMAAPRSLTNPAIAEISLKASGDPSSETAPPARVWGNNRRSASEGRWPREERTWKNLLTQLQLKRNLQCLRQTAGSIADFCPWDCLKASQKSWHRMLNSTRSTRHVNQFNL